MTRVVFALERDAKTDPPKHPGGVLTDQGLAWYAHTPNRDGPWYSELGAYGSPPLDPQPRVWYDLPRGTDRAGLTVEDLEAAHDAAQMLTGSDFHKRDWPRMYRCQDRLRAALDALNTKDDS